MMGSSPNVGMVKIGKDWTRLPKQLLDLADSIEVGLFWWGQTELAQAENKHPRGPRRHQTLCLPSQPHRISRSSHTLFLQATVDLTNRTVASSHCPPLNASAQTPCFCPNTTPSSLLHSTLPRVMPFALWRPSIQCLPGCGAMASTLSWNFYGEDYLPR